MNPLDVENKCKWTDEVKITEKINIQVHLRKLEYGEKVHFFL